MTPAEEAWERAHPHIEPDLFLFPWDLDPSLIMLMARVMAELPDGDLTVHSDFRPPDKGKSYHYTGRAVDFRLTRRYSSMKRTALETYYDDYLALLEALKTTGDLDLVGLGIYPNQRNPFFHLDSRGRRGRWSRLSPSGTSYVSMAKGLAWLRQIIDGDEIVRQSLHIDSGGHPLPVLHVGDARVCDTVPRCGTPHGEGETETCQD